MFKARPSLLVCALVLAACDYNNDGTLPDTPAPADPNMPKDAAGAGVVLDGGLGGSLDARVLLDAVTPPDAYVTSNNESFETALRIDEQAGVLQDITHSAQTNYFVFDAPSAGFYELRTSAHDFSPDVVLSLYDDSRILIAQNDQGSLWPGDDVDARLVVRLTRAGRYFAVVSDPSTPANFFGKGKFPVRYYQLSFRSLSPSAAGVGYEQNGAPAVPRFVLDEPSGYSYVTVVGTLEAGTVDEFVLAGQDNQALISHLLASGTLGNGSTGQAGPVRVRDKDARLLAEIDGLLGHLQIFPPIGAGDNRLTVGAPDVVQGNAFYALDLVLLPDNPREQNEAGNGALGGAELIQVSGTQRRRGLLLADVPGGDVDYFRVSAARGEGLLLSCEGQGAGSGVRMLHAELRDANDKTLAVAQESATHDLDIESFTLPADGNYYVRLDSDHVLSEGEAEPWVRCVVIVGS